MFYVYWFMFWIVEKGLVWFVWEMVRLFYFDCRGVWFLVFVYIWLLNFWVGFVGLLCKGFFFWVEDYWYEISLYGFGCWCGDWWYGGKMFCLRGLLCCVLLVEWLGGIGLDGWWDWIGRWNGVGLFFECGWFGYNWG